jgi:hypothetical protein
MIEQSLVYIHSTKPARRFVGCGTLVEGGYVATCRHVWHMATDAAAKAAPGEPARVEIEYPRAYQNGGTVRSAAHLADVCDVKQGQALDLVLLQPDLRPENTMELQLAVQEKFEAGAAYALIGLAGRDKTRPDVPEDVRIDGKIADHKNARGLRQFTGINESSYWSGRGSSGSPVFLQQGQHLAGILCRSELGANDGNSSLHEAFIVPGMTIRPFVVKAIGERAAKVQHLDLATACPQLRPLAQFRFWRNIPESERERIGIKCATLFCCAKASNSELFKSSVD